jgi:hypothetical protein
MPIPSHEGTLRAPVNHEIIPAMISAIIKGNTTVKNVNTSLESFFILLTRGLFLATIDPTISRIIANISAIRGFQFSFFGDGIGDGVVNDQGFGFSPVFKAFPHMDRKPMYRCGDR